MVYCNAGSTTTNQKGMFGNFSIWYNLQGIANVLSLKMFTDHYLVTYSSNDSGGVFTVHTPKGNIEFICYPHGLHYLDLAKPQLPHVLIAMTIKENYDGYTKNQIDGAILAQHWHGMMWHPSQCDFENLVHDQTIQNCPITYHDVTNADKIFGPDLAGLRGTTVQKDPTTIQPEYVEIPREMTEQNKMVTLTADIMFVNEVPFIVTCRMKKQ